MTRHTEIKIMQNEGGAITAEISGDMSTPNILLAFAILQTKLIKGDFNVNSKNEITEFTARNLGKELKEK